MNIFKSVCRALCFIFTAQYIIAHIQGNGGLLTLIFAGLIAFTASVGWDK